MSDKTFNMFNEKLYAICKIISFRHVTDIQEHFLSKYIILNVNFIISSTCLLHNNVKYKDRFDLLH